IGTCCATLAVSSSPIKGQTRDSFKTIYHHLTAALHHTKDRRPFLRQCATTTWTFESVSPSYAPLVLQHLRMTFMDQRAHLRRNIRLCITLCPTIGCMVMEKRANVTYLILTVP